MADTKISALDAAGALDGTEKIPVVKGGANKYATPSTIKDYAVTAAAIAALGVVRRLDLGLVTAADLATGPVVLYTPSAGEIAGPIFIRDYELPPTGIFFKVTSSEQGNGMAYLGGSDESRDSVGIASNGQGQPPGDVAADTSTAYVIPTTSTAISVGYVSADSERLATPWAANTTYTAGFVYAVGHLWVGAAGTSGGSTPDFAGNIGGSVVDNDIEWFDSGVVPTTGQIHVYADACVPIAP